MIVAVIQTELKAPRFVQFKLRHILTLTLIVAIGVNAWLFSWRLAAIFAIVLLPALLMNFMLVRSSKFKSSYWRNVMRVLLLSAGCFAFYLLSIGPAISLMYKLGNSSVASMVEYLYEPLELFNDKDHPVFGVWLRYVELWYPEE